MIMPELDLYHICVLAFLHIFPIISNKIHTILIVIKFAYNFLETRSNVYIVSDRKQKCSLSLYQTSEGHVEYNAFSIKLQLLPEKIFRHVFLLWLGSSLISTTSKLPLIHAAGLSEDGATFDVQEGSGFVDSKDFNQSEHKLRKHALNFTFL